MSRDREFMDTPKEWPLWPVLPLVQHGTGQAGFLTEGKPRVYIGNIFDNRFDNFKDYESFDAIIADGWRVD